MTITAQRRQTLGLTATIGVGATALLLPPTFVATLLVGAGGPAVEAVVTGVWVLKAVMLLNLALFLGWFRAAAGPTDGRLSEPPSGIESIGRAGDAWLVGLLLVAAAVLRLYDLGNGLWYDEIATLVDYVRMPVSTIVTTFDSQNQHVLYSLLAHTSIGVFGEGAWALRLPAALLGVASVWAVYWFGLHVTGRRESLLAAAFLTFSYHHLWFSQNARGYSGLLLWTLVSSGLFIRLLRDGPGDRRLLPVTYGVAAALGVYTHLTAVFVVAAHAAVWGVLAWRRRQRCSGAALWQPAFGILMATSLTLLFYALVLPQLFDTLLTPTMAGVETDWKSPVWFLTETLGGLSRGVPGGLAAVLVALLVVGIGFASYGRQDPAVIALMILPGVGLAVALVVTRHNLWPRMFLFSAGFAALILIRGVSVIAGVVSRQWAPRLATAGALALIAGSAFLVPRAWNPKQDFLGALAHVERERGPEDAVVTVDLTTLPYREYLSLDWPSVSTVGELQDIEGRHPRTWVLYTFPVRLAAEHEEIWQRLTDEYSLVREYPGTVGGGAVIIKVRGGDS